jgi:hypothetical protein
MGGQAHAEAFCMVVGGGIFRLVVAADAQTPSPPAANTQFDGTYAFVSSTRVNETYMLQDQIDSANVAK